MKYSCLEKLFQLLYAVHFDYQVIQMFRGCRPEDMPPHVYATAQISYRNMLATRMDQSIIMMGRSGSGKTSNARHMLHYLTVAAGTVNNTLSGEILLLNDFI